MRPRVAGFLLIVAMSLNGPRAIAGDQVPPGLTLHKLFRLTNERPKVSFQISLMVDAGGVVKGIYSDADPANAVNDPSGKNPSVLALNDMNSARGAVLINSHGFDAILLRGSLDDKAKSGRFSLVYISNGVSQTYESCDFLVNNKTGDWAAENINTSETITAANTKAWLLGVTTVIGICPKLKDPSLKRKILPYKPDTRNGIEIKEPIYTAISYGKSVAHEFMYGAATLDQKLASQWIHYGQARALLLQRFKDPSLTPSQKIVSRAQWEAVLAPEPWMELTAQDLEELKTRQASRIAIARAQAVQNSRIDFAKIRSLTGSEARVEGARFCSQVPKGGMLHIHPLGTIDKETARSILTRDQMKIPFAQMSSDLGNQRASLHLFPTEINWLRSVPGQVPYSALSAPEQDRLLEFFSLPPGVQPFSRFNATFSFISMAENLDSANDLKIFEDFAARAAAEKVSYVEFSTNLYPAVMPFYENLAADLEAKYGVVVRFNQAFARETPMANQFDQIDSALEQIHSPLVTGIDLVGEGVARAAAAGALGATALEHEALDHAVERQPVVEALLRERREILDRLRRVGVEELDLDCAL